MTEQFRVDLRGIVTLLGHHLYSNESVYLRELLQNARDAIEARRRLGHDVPGSIEIVPARGHEQLVVRDNGIGLTNGEMRQLLSTIGSSSKRDDVVSISHQFLGQFGIGLLACFLVADSIEVVSRSARTPDAATIRWLGRADGTFTIEEAGIPLDEPGTEVRLRPRHGAHRWCNTEACRVFATEFAELLDVPVHLAGELMSQTTPPWELSTDLQLAWCREHFGFEAMGIVKFNASLSKVVGLAFVLPYTAQLGHRTGDRIYSKGMLVAEADDHILPRWAFFCRAVIDAGELPVTASREGLQESGSLQVVRKQIGFRLLSELIVVQCLRPDIYQDIVALHSTGLKALAVQEIDMRELLQSTLPYRTTHGDRTIEELLREPTPVSYLADADTYDALSDVATWAGMLVVNASGMNETELLRAINESRPASFREIAATDIIDLVDPIPCPDVEAAARLVDKARRALEPEDLDIEVAGFEPSERAVLWWPVDRPGAAAQWPARLILNSANPAVKRLIDAPADAPLAEPLRALFVTGLLVGRVRLSVGQTSLLATALQAMLESSAPEPY